MVEGTFLNEAILGSLGRLSSMLHFELRQNLIPQPQDRELVPLGSCNQPAEKA